MARFLLIVMLLLLFLPLVSGCSDEKKVTITPTTGLMAPEPRPGGKGG